MPSMKHIAPVTFFGSAAIALGLILFASLAPDSM